ncbi:TonB-dependent receptor [Roseateles sp.]|uniref:TonB-dependent receptor n=1 Tax=Roseateles sp. TaxID=1971397 RepID=UPI003BA75745
MNINPQRWPALNTGPRPRRLRGRFLRQPTQAAVHLLMLGLVGLACLPALAQDAGAGVKKFERVEVTGSAIKRIEAEGALPVQIITRADMVKAGITTAAELIANLSAASNNLTDGVSIANGGSRDQMGFNSANLRGLGTSSTLVLLNGRRMANFASPGDDAGVDLNNIPSAAIERVEVLLDGASAIYGTDAIGGVVNFITRKDYQGLDLDAYVGASQEGGAGKRTASLAAGFGDLARDRFNLFGVFDIQHTDALNTSQRKFIGELQIPQRLPHLLSSYPMPANIFLSSDQLEALQNQGFKINGRVPSTKTINLSAPQCNPPHSLNLVDGIGGPDGCTFDYMRDLELYPQSKKLSFLGRGVLALGDKHQAFVELALSEAKTHYVGTSSRIRLRRANELDTALIPGLDTALPGEAVEIRARLLEAGNRKTALNSRAERVVLGMSGSLGSWDYDWGLNHSVNKVAERDASGYLLYEELIDGFRRGLVNPFGPSSAAGKAYLNSIQVNDEVRSARGAMSSLDFKTSGSLMKLGGGNLALALGAELRHESTDSKASELLLSDNINEDWTPGDSQFVKRSRRVWAVFGELVAPLSKELELQFALRHDNYQNIGGTSNPKLGLRYQAAKELVLRASAGTGFRAPSLNDLYRPPKSSSTSVLPDPVYCAANGNDLRDCANNWSTVIYSGPNLKPEKSKQFSMGMVFEPIKDVSLGLDYWNIAKTNLISTIGEDIILGNLGKYGALVHRYNMDEGIQGCDYDPDDYEICFIELRKENRGKQRSSGLDLSFEVRRLTSPLGQWGAKMAGTWVLKSEKQTGFGDDFVSDLGKFVTTGAVQRWRHRLSLDWTYGPWSLAVGNTYSSGYTDQNSAIDTNSGTMVGANKVKAYSLWDMAGAWEASKSLTLRAGVKNLLNTAPPYSNQAYHFISGYDPSYTDPRGRFVYLSAQYQFR